MARIPVLTRGGVPQVDFSAIGRIPQAFQKGQLTAERLQDIAEARADRDAKRASDEQLSAALSGADFSTPGGFTAAGQNIAQNVGAPGLPTAMELIRTGSTLENQAASRRNEAARLGIAQAGATRAQRQFDLGLEDRARKLATIEGQREFARENNIDPRLVGTPLFQEAAKAALGVEEEMTPFQQETIRLREEAAAQKRQAETAERQAGEVANIERAQRIVAPIDRAITLTETSPTATGITGATIGFLPGSDRRSLEADLATIKGNLAFKNLEDLKRRGVSMGALSDSEREAAGNLDAALDPNLSPEQLARNLRAVRSLQRKIDPSIPEYQPPEAPQTRRQRRQRRGLATGEAVEVTPGVTIKRIGD